MFILQENLSIGEQEHGENLRNKIEQFKITKKLTRLQWRWDYNSMDLRAGKL